MPIQTDKFGDRKIVTIHRKLLMRDLCAIGLVQTCGQRVFLKFPETEEANFVVLEEVGEFAARVRRAEHDDLAEIFRLAGGYIVSRN